MKPVLANSEKNRGLETGPRFAFGPHVTPDYFGGGETGGSGGGLLPVPVSTFGLVELLPSAFGAELAPPQPTVDTAKATTKKPVRIRRTMRRCLRYWVERVPLLE
jgi:hypothetical protein